MPQLGHVNSALVITPMFSPKFVVSQNVRCDASAKRFVPSQGDDHGPMVLTSTLCRHVGMFSRFRWVNPYEIPEAENASWWLRKAARTLSKETEGYALADLLAAAGQST